MQVLWRGPCANVSAVTKPPSETLEVPAHDVTGDKEKDSSDESEGDENEQDEGDRSEQDEDVDTVQDTGGIDVVEDNADGNTSTQTVHQASSINETPQKEHGSILCKSCASGKSSIGYMKCEGCHLWVCKDISCGFPSQSCCNVCAPELLTVVHLRQGNEDWWTGTPGSTSREYRHQVLSELQTCVFLKFGENSQCLNNDTARSCLRLWVNAIDKQSLEQAKTSCNSLPQSHPTAVVPAHPWQVGSKSQYHVKIVVPTEDMQQPRSFKDDREHERAEATRLAALVCPSQFLEMLVLAYYKCIAGSTLPDPSYYPTVSYSSCNLVGQSYNPFGNGPGNAVFLLAIQKECWLVFRSLERGTPTEAQVMVVHMTEGSGLLVSKDLRYKYDLDVWRTDTQRGPPRPLQPHHKGTNSQ